MGKDHGVNAPDPRGREIDVIDDSLSSHKTDQVKEFFAEYPNVRLYITLTYSS